MGLAFSAAQTVSAQPRDETHGREDAASKLGAELGPGHSGTQQQCGQQSRSGGTVHAATLVMSRATPLPIAPMPSPAGKAVATAPLLRRVLVVEDDGDIRALYAELLHGAGYETIEAENGEQALALALAQPFSAVVMDLEMPEMGGLDTTRALKQNDRTREIPVIVVTGSANALDLLASREAGCAALLAKPCPTDVLLSSLEHVLRGEPIPLRFSAIGG